MISPFLGYYLLAGAAPRISIEKGIPRGFFGTAKWESQHRVAGLTKDSSQTKCSQPASFCK